MGLFGSDIEKFKGQDYASLRKKCVDSKELFEDPLFPANENSLNLSKPLYGKLVWKRPPELCEGPKLFVEKASSKDVTQGRLGNCWFVAACGALATVKSLWSQVIPDYKFQEWDPVHAEQYAGIFHFRFWRFGKWIDVVVDDLLPTIDGQLIFCHSTTENEFWSALVEKAYAKLCGSYGSMDGGNLSDALVDFTAGLSEMVELKNNGYDQEEKRNALRKQLLKEHEEHALMCCAITTADSSLFESRTKSGLVLGHAYGITDVKEINIGQTSLLSFFKEREKLTLLRLRNPWGAKEWTGAFSDSSPEWTKISKSEKDKLGLTFEDDGEFWIPFDDFVTEFSDLCICHLINTSFMTFKKTWYGNAFEGQWTLPNNAGGCPNHPTLLNNPQYCFDVPKDGMEITVLLLQTDVRSQWDKPRNSSESRYKSIGFHVMQVEDNREHRAHRLGKKAITSDYIMGRSVYYQGTLDSGRYILLPTTFDPKIETEYYLRIYTDSQIEVKELKTDYPEPSMFSKYCCCAAVPMCVTTITVEGATGLSKAEDTYCVVKVEGKKLKSDVFPNSQTPEWKISGVFFRQDVCKPIFVELWAKRLVRDKFLGCAVIAESANNAVRSVTSPLVGRGRKQADRHPGELKCTVVTYDDIAAS